MTIDPIQQIDLIVRGGSLAMLVMLAGLLWRRYRNALAARLAAAMLVLIACHVLATMQTPFNAVAPVRMAVAIGAALVPTSFWLFARCWFNDQSRIGPAAWSIAGAAFALATLRVVLAQVGGESPYSMQVVVRVMLIGFTLGGLKEAWHGRSDDLVEERRRMRTGLIWAVGLFALATNGVEIMSDQGVLPDVSGVAIELGILILCLAFGLLLLDLRTPDLFSGPEKGIKPVMAPVDDEAAARLHSHMMAEKAWRDEAFSIAKLASQLGEQEYRLRRLINGRLGYRNFAAFLSRYRLDEVRAALIDPSQREVPISTIALDAGFGSLGPFNRVFRGAEGMTPSEYRARHTG